MARSGRGRNSADQLGDGSTTYRQMPVQVRDDAGAIVDTTLRATLRGRPRAIPRPGDPDGRSTAGITLKAERGEVGWRLQVQQLLVPATEAHIHEGGPAALCSISCCHPRRRGADGRAARAPAGTILSLAGRPPRCSQ
jgi:hypothetical protein